MTTHNAANDGAIGKNHPRRFVRCGIGHSLRPLLWAGCAVAAGLLTARSAAAKPPNVVLIVTDDQRWDTLPGVAPDYMPQDVMPHLGELLMDRGTVFEQALVSAPLCCPSRASLLSGGFQPFHNGMRNNLWPNGGARRFNDTRTVATFLKAKNYRTALVGKYLNEYGLLAGQDTHGDPIAPGRYVPPAWDVWVGQDNGNYNNYNFTLGISGAGGPEAGVLLPDDAGDLEDWLQRLESQGFPPTMIDYFRSIDVRSPPYVTDFQADLAVAFVEDAARWQQPFFLMVSTTANHVGAKPHPDDEGRFPDFEYRARGWGEGTLTDKPDYIREESKDFEGYYDGSIEFTGDGRTPDELFADMLRTLVAVDRMVRDLVEAVEADPDLRDNTYFVFTSDHGYQWGEHKAFHKEKPYEESIRVPLVIRAPGQTEPRTHKKIVAANLDLAATLFELAGYDREYIKAEIGSDGESLVPILDGSEPKVRKDLLLEDMRMTIPSWSCIRGQKWKYISYDDGEEELYNLKADPFELLSKHDSDNPKHVKKKAKLIKQLDKRQGLFYAFEYGADRTSLPNARRGDAYEFTMASVGGEGKVSWDLYEDPDLPDPGNCEGRMPAGLEVTSDGLITGTPTETGCFIFWVRGRDRTESPIDGQPQTFYKKMRLKVTN